MKIRKIYRGFTVDSLDGYAFRYDNKNNHKILRLGYVDGKGYRADHIDVYDFSSDSWEVPDVELEWDGLFHRGGLSSKGNTYFFSRKLIGMINELGFEEKEYENYLLCFDFEKKNIWTASAFAV